MSRPSTKRRRYGREPVDDDKHQDTFASPSTAHIFATGSSRSAASSDILHPRSYEITLNHDVDLKRSLYPPPSPIQTGDDRLYGSRSVTCTSACGTQSVTTDRYDAVHLLQQLPSQPSHTDPRQRANLVEDLGWSDLDSDAEDLFYMTDAEAADFAHSKARAALEAQRTTRLARLPSPSPPTDCSTRSHANPVEIEERPCLSKTQFDLMRKTAKIISSSANPAQLELKILANHGADQRFAFLHKGDEHQILWEALKANKETTFEAASAMLDDTKVDKPRGAGLVAYDDSDTDSDPESPPRTAQPTVDEAKEPDEAALKKQKQAERLARAKIWLQSPSSQPSNPPPSS